MNGNAPDFIIGSIFCIDCENMLKIGIQFPLENSSGIKYNINNILSIASGESISEDLRSGSISYEIKNISCSQAQFFW